METLTTTLQDMMTPDLIARIATESGLPASKVETGMSGAVGSIFDGLAYKANDTRVMNRVASLISTGPDVDVVQPDQLLEPRSPVRDTGQQLLAIAAPDRGGLVSRLSSMLGVGANAAGGLVASAAGLVFAAFRKLGRVRGGLDARDVSVLLHDEAPAIHAAMPVGFVTPTRTSAYAEHDWRGDVVRREHPRSMAWLWLLLLIPLAFIAYWLFARPRTETASVDVPAFAPFSAVEREIELQQSTMPDRAVAPVETNAAPATPEATMTPPGATAPDESMGPTDESPSESTPESSAPAQPMPPPRMR